MSSAVFLYIYELCSFFNLSVTSPTSQHSPTLPSLYLRHSSFPNPSVALPTSQFILQPFFRFSYVTSSSLNSEQSSFSNLSVTSPTSQHSPTLPSLYLRHSSFSNSSVASPTSQFILQPFFCFSYVTSSSLISPGKPPMLSQVFHSYFVNM